MDSKGFKYCPGSGLMFSNKTCGRWKPRLLRPVPNQGYFKVPYKDRKIFLHRMAYFMMTGKEIPRRSEIDHINGNRQDNRWVNLRLVSKRDNMNNQRIHREGAPCGVRKKEGQNRWEAHITVMRRQLYLGNFETLEEAVIAREAAYKVARIVDDLLLKEA